MKALAIIRTTATSWVQRLYLDAALLVVLVALLAFWGFPLKYCVALGGLYLAIVIPFNSRFVSGGIQKGLRDVRRDYLSLAVVAILVILLYIWGATLESIAFVATFVCFLLYQWDSRIVATGAIVSLAACPVLLIAKQQSIAEQMAVYAYYFLVMTVALQIVEYKRHPELAGDQTKYE